MRRLILCALLLAGAAGADEVVTIAVASNFARTALELGVRFERDTRIPVRFSQGSTGKLYAQIVNGAPFDVFLAADARRPALLERAAIAVAGSRFTYANGALAIWSRSARDCRAALRTAARVALANPETAPYGAAARAYLVNEGIWPVVSARAAYGENIAQALQFVASGNASVGFVARSQLADPRVPAGSCRFDVPASPDAPLEQQGVLLAASHAGARRFVAYLQSPAARALIRRHGYEVGE